MKKLFVCLCLLLLSLSIPYADTYAQGETNVFVYGKNVIFDAPPVILDGKTLVPLRAICDALDADVEWDAGRQSITITKGGTVNTLVINKKIAVKTQYQVSSNITLDVPPMIMGDKTFVPLRYIAESFGIKVSWDGNSQSIYIGEYDVDAVGEYAGYRKLLNHEYEGVWDIYFKQYSEGNITSTEVQGVPLTLENMDEVVEYMLPNGEVETLTRGQWYKLFAEVSDLWLGDEVLQERYGDFYFKWYDLYHNPNLSSIVDVYLHRGMDLAPPNYDRPEKWHYDWYGERELEVKGIKIDYDKYDVTYELGDHDILYKVAGSVQLVKENTHEILKTINLNAFLSPRREVVVGESIEFTQDGIALRMSQSTPYKLEFSGDDLVRLGVIE